MTTASLPQHVPLAVATRGDHIENLHAGSLVVVDANGNVVTALGDVAFPVFARSTLKPFQALPFVAAGGLARFGWGVDETALLCASHSAEAEHLAVVQHMLDTSGHTVADLGCGAHVPMHYAATGTHAPGDGAWSALHNNCSGKHAGFLACCALHGWPHDDCLTPTHPLQMAIRGALAELAGRDIDAAPRGIDGCNAPVYALPLTALARAYAVFAAGTAAPALRDAALALRDAMRARPQLVSGAARFDLALARIGAGDFVVKSGADGVQTVASVSRRQALALKLADGNPRVAHVVTIAALRQIGWLTDPLPAEFALFAAPPIHNWRGVETGRIEPVFTLP